MLVTTGNELVDQFQPWYFGVAAAFSFSFLTGMPDLPEFKEGERFRRCDGAPRVEHPLWDRIFARRVEGQFIRDWQLGFMSWNYLFKSMLNLSRIWYSYDRGVCGADLGGVTAKDLEVGAIQIVKALSGSYVDPSGRKRAVNGDLTKLRFVPGMSPAALRLLKNIETVSRKIPGMQETRRQMRFHTHALRVRFGVPIVVTFSPDEEHNLIMVRLARVRRKDPVLLENEAARLYNGMLDPALAPEPGGLGHGRGGKQDEEVVIAVPLVALSEAVPDYNTRRRILARDSLASVDGFRMMLLLLYEHLWGMRVCIHCPRCSADSYAGKPCADMFGSNASPDGGSLGRAEAGYTSIEAQKSTGNLHGHSQVCVQCVHQHAPLTEMLRSSMNKDLVNRYLLYKHHVCRQVYASSGHVETWRQERRGVVEARWPEYERSGLMLCRPRYLVQRDDHEADAEAAAERWLREYLHVHVQQLQEHKQHHVHIWNEELGRYLPLRHCRRKDKPLECKSDFPRDRWLIDQPVVLCPGLLDQMGMPSAGRRCRLGSLHGPMNDANLNGTSPAMLVCQGCNSDVQLPYRMPLCAASHSDLCDRGEACLRQVDPVQMAHAAQACQDAQAGYACDYQNKRQPCGCTEVRAACAGHRALTPALEGRSENQIRKRHMTRIMSDAYSKGVEKSAVENRNLRVEAFRTCPTVAFYGKEYGRSRILSIRQISI